ncbi:hypothetical protein ABT237_33420, partial [Streptomyces sp. NPDC001581]|uniref:hypothetical protein n=1 Tax=Streptomyces sp. NPDC001581 TaxID=3154386 RepID=UPI0033191FCB
LSPRRLVPCIARRRGARVLDVLGRPDNAARRGARRRGSGEIRKRRPSPGLGRLAGALEARVANLSKVRIDPGQQSDLAEALVNELDITIGDD